MQVLHEQSQPDQNKMGYLNIEGDDPSKSSQNFESFSSHLHQENRASENSLNNFTMTRAKIFKLLGILFIVLAYGIIWKQDFQTSSQGPVNRPQLDEIIQSDEKIEKQLTPSQKQYAEELSKKEKEQAIRKQCYKVDELRNQVFFISFDKEQMTKQQVARFQSMNYYCHFNVLYEKAFDQLADLWNIREEQLRYDQEYINKTAITKDERRHLFIWLRLYFWAGTYVHASLGVDFGKEINDRYLFDAKVGKQIAFAKVDHQNEKGIFVPEKHPKTIKVGQRLSEWVRKVIRKIIAKQDWMQMCQNYQCLIIKNAIKLPEGL